MEVNRVLFNVCFEWHEVVVNERSGLVVAVRLGFQPSTSASCGRRAEIDQQRSFLRFGFGECRVSVCQPMYFHVDPPLVIRQSSADLSLNVVVFVPFVA
jgi:hypothetical protein